MEGGDEGVVCVVEESEGFGAIGVGLVELDRVVDDGVGVQVLCLVSWALVMTHVVVQCCSAHVVL